MFGEVRIELLEDVLETAIGVFYVQGFVFPLLLRILSKLVAFEEPLLLFFGDGLVGVGATGWVGALEGGVRKLGALLVAAGRGRGQAVVLGVEVEEGGGAGLVGGEAGVEGVAVVGEVAFDLLV